MSPCEESSVDLVAPVHQRSTFVMKHRKPHQPSFPREAYENTIKHYHFNDNENAELTTSRNNLNKATFETQRRMNINNNMNNNKISQNQQSYNTETY